jgi:integrase
LKDIKPTELSARAADEFIRDLRATRRDNGEAMDADSVRLVVAVCSTFYTFLERRFDEVRSPFRGTRARPIATWPIAQIPSEKEIHATLEVADPITRAALMIVIETGLRVGGLPGLIINKDGSWWTLTKGKRFYGLEPLTARTRKTIKAASLDSRRPFSPSFFPYEENRRRAKGPLTENQLVQRLKQHIVRKYQDIFRHIADFFLGLEESQVDTNRVRISLKGSGVGDKSDGRLRKLEIGSKADVPHLHDRIFHQGASPTASRVAAHIDDSL